MKQSNFYRSTKLAIVLSELAKEKALYKSEKQLCNIISTYADAIAHNLRTPLAIIKMNTSQLEQMLPLITKICMEAKEKKLVTAAELSDSNLQYLLDNLLNSFKDSAIRMNNMIDNNLQSLENALSLHNGIAKKINLLECSIAENLKDSNLYIVFRKEEKHLLHKELGHIFNYMGNSITMDQILMNILQNALYQIRKNGKGEIFLSTEDGGDKNIIRVRDTAGGASAEVVAHMFDSFFTTKSDGNGIGLDFSKKAMQLFGGDITAESIEGDYMEFILTFPKIHKN